MGAITVLRECLKLLDMLEVRGKTNRKIVDAVVSNIEAILEVVDKPTAEPKIDAKMEQEEPKNDPA